MAEQGSVAMLVPQGSYLWDGADTHNQAYYRDEPVFLHTALAHAGYTVDFLDDVDVAGGELSRRGHRVLYVIGPNVTSAAQQAIADWVAAGGTLVASPGAAVADEYNEPSTLLDGVLGVQSRQAVRDLFLTRSQNLPQTGVVTVSDPRFASAPLDLHTPLAPLVLDGAQPIGTFSDGTVGLTLHSHGSGQAIAYGFFSGAEYSVTPDVSDIHHLPLNYSATWRTAAVAPVRVAQVQRSVEASQEMVEPLRLDSPAGTAVVLLNWSDVPIPCLRVTVHNARTGAHVTSIEGTPVQTHQQGDELAVQLALGSTDVLMIE